MNAELKPEKESRLRALRAALGQGTLRSAHRMVNALHPAEIALLHRIAARPRSARWSGSSSIPSSKARCCVELNENVRAALIEGMEREELLAAAEDMELDDLARPGRRPAGDRDPAAAASPWTSRTASG